MGRTPDPGGGPSPAPSAEGPLLGGGAGLPSGLGEGGERGERSELARRGRVFILIRPSQDLFFSALSQTPE